jgi:hypothetical protein
MVLSAGQAVATPARTLRIAYTAETHGNLLPCVCPGHPLGGLARRVGFLDSLRSGSADPTFVVDAGKFFADRSEYPAITDRDLRTLRDLQAAAAKEAGYDAVLLDMGISAPAETGPWLPSGAARAVTKAGVRVLFLALDERSDLETARGSLDAAGPADLTVLLCSGDLNFAQAAAQMTGAQVAIVSRGACFSEPLVRDEVLYLGPGRAGKYVGVADCSTSGGGKVKAAQVRLRPMDGGAPSSAVWQERVERTVLAIERTSPSTFTQGE